MFKKILLLSALSLSFGTAARADDFVYIPYIGADYAYVRANAHSMRPAYHAGSVNIGTKYNDFFGTEMFYQQTGSESKKISSNQKYKSSYRAYGLDVSAYLPLGCYHQADLFATAGFGEYVFNKKFSGEKHRNDSGYGYRFGGGLVFNLNENVSLRTLVRYINLDKVSGYDHMVEYAAGIRYHFL